MREIRINLGEIMPIIEEKLASGGEVLFSPSGSSMLPILRAGRDTVVLVSPPQELKKYDIALFKRADSRYVLHRVISVGEGGYTFIGDNRFECEPNVAREDIIALCIACVRGDRRIALNSFFARLVACLWHTIRPLRRFWQKAVIKISFILKKIKQRRGYL